LAAQIFIYQIEFMKLQLLTAMLCCVILFPACKKTSLIAPEAVLTAFKARFPSVENADWSMEDETEWEAEFKKDGKEMSANFMEDGTWVGTETGIKSDALPHAVLDAILAQFEGYKIEEAALLEGTELALAYEVELKKDQAVFETVFSSEGTLIMQRTELEEGGDKD
jgi:hypothetical protein